MNSAEKLKKLRKDMGLTQEELIAKLPFELSLSALRNYENTTNPRLPVHEILVKLAEFYNVSVEYLKNNEMQRNEETITITMEEYKELLITKGKYEALKERYNYTAIPAYRECPTTLKDFDLSKVTSKTVDVTY